MYRFVLVASLALAACSATADPTTSNEEPGTLPAAVGEPVELRYVFDGDSIEVSLADGTPAEIRLIGINAPEGDECHGDDSRTALEALLADADLSIAADEEDVEEAVDQFGRLLRYVHAGNRDVNLSLIASGDALALQSGHSREPEFVAASDAAAADGLGMWSESVCEPQVPVPSIEIADYVFDPQGRDSDNPNDEWVTLTNQDAASVDMTNWILRDESTRHRFIFPGGFRLEHGASVTIHSGCGDPSPQALFWCASDPVWSNGGDTIVLQQAGGIVVARERYDGNF